MANLLVTLVTVLLSFSVSAKSADLSLSQSQEASFRAWFTRIIWEQFRYQPNKRWHHRDCAGLVRFALKESFNDHNLEWYRLNSIASNLRPPEMNLTAEQKKIIPAMEFKRAIQLIQTGTRFISKNFNQALPGDLLFYDFGDTHHLMVWMGSYITYHKGSSSKKDNGLRKQTLNTLMTWKDTRWRPLEHNPNFIGIFRFSFLH